MARQHFGTDGIRGVANQKLTPELCFQIGTAAGRLLCEQHSAPKVLLGRDTRRSGAMLGAALASGFCAAGVDAHSVGICPTGGISYLARTGDYALACVISASHNPAPDNGVKLIAHDGRKVTDAFEESVEALLEVPLAPRKVGSDVGLLETGRDEISRYRDYLLSLVPEGLSGLKVVVDGSDGAAYELGADVIRSLGAEVIEIGNRPDGMNINRDSGATKPEAMQALTASEAAAIGVAFDGDADRAVFSDSHGRLINGDRTMAIWGRHHRATLVPPSIVGTVMSNGGFEAYLQAQGIELHRVNVGDKYVSAKLAETNGRVGGEQSGHIIFPDRGPTGDGLITALEILRVLKQSGLSAADFFDEFANWPQVLVNVSVASRDSFLADEKVQRAIADAEGRLAGQGRVNVRASGTQPMVRVMVESHDVALRDSAVDSIVDAMVANIGGSIYSKVDLTHALGD
jgi:phosphoglucosamine mutase